MKCDLRSFNFYLSGLEEEGLYRVAGVSSKFTNLIKIAIGMQ